MPTPAGSAASPRYAIAWPVWLAAIALAALLIAYPPFNVISKKEVAANRAALAGADAFDPAVFAERFWSDKLQPAAATAPDLAPVLSALRNDPAAAVETHARSVGLGGTAYFFLKGGGRVTAVERSRILVEIDGAVIALRTGPVFGNAVRDGTGLIDVNEVPGLTEFNALSAELNRLLEQRIQPALTAAVVGSTIQFSGCAEAPQSLPAGRPLLTFIPVHVEVKP